MKILQVITVTFLTLLLCNSCQKNDVANTPILTQVKPTVKDGRLNFTSKDELKQYYLDIESAMKESEDKEAVLKSFESQYDYVPLRTVRVTPNSINLRNDDEYFTLEEILLDLEFDFIGDEIQKSLLSEYYEVGIASDVYVFMNGDQTFTLQQDNTAAINALREVDKKSTEIPVDFLDRHSDVEYNSPSKHYGQSERAVYGPSPSAIYYRYFFSGTFNNADCLLYDKDFAATVKEIEMDDNGTPNNSSDDIELNRVDYSGDFLFSFGDGTSQSFNNTTNPSVTHTYGSTGTFQAVISVTYVDRYGNTQYDEETKNVLINSVCQEDDFHVGEWTTSTPTGTSTAHGDVAIATKLWFNRNFWGTHLGSFTKSYRWDSSRAKWRKERADIEVEIWGSLRDDNCVTQWSNQDDDFDANSCWVDAKMHCVFNYNKRDIADEDIYSQHTANFDNGIILEDDLILRPCE